MRSGVHCSIRNGFSGALTEAHQLGCETLQIFTQSPRGWKTRVYLEEEYSEFKKKRLELNLFPVVVHSPYLPNLCTTNESLYKKSLQSLIEDLSRCEKLGAEYLVIHPGAYSPDSTPQKGISRLITAFNLALKKVTGTSMILIENMAGGGRRVGGQFSEIGQMLKGIDQKDRVGVCFDTCHALAAGYDISNEMGVGRTLEEFDQHIGLANLKIFHVNDSKGPVGCHRDRHENLGKGHVGLAGFKALFTVSDFSQCAFILETPKEPIPQSDLKNLKTLRSCLPHPQKSPIFG